MTSIHLADSIDEAGRIARALLGVIKAAEQAAMTTEH